MSDGADEQSLDRLLACVPHDERKAALKTLAESLHGSSDVVLARWIIRRLQQTADRALEQALIQYLARLRDSEAWEDAALLCADSRRLAQCLIHQSVKDLDQHLNAVHEALEKHRQDVQDYSQPHVSDHVNGSVSRVAASQATSASPVENATVVRAVRCMNFLSHPPILEFVDPTDGPLLASLLRALESLVPLISKGAKFACLAWIQFLAANPQSPEAATSLAESTWQWASGAINYGGNSMVRAAAASLWLAMLDVWVVQDLATVIDESALQALQLALIDGDTELRRLVLLIVRKSVQSAVDGDVTISHPHLTITKANKANVLIDFRKYCTVYETIVLGRYINQIREIEIDMTRLMGRDTILPGSWMLTLLQPAMSNKMQDSIRNFIGGIILQSTFPIDVYPRLTAQFLQESVLPWVSKGVHFTSSIVGDRNELRCVHGQMLSDFIRQLLSAPSRGSYDEAARTFCLQTILSFLLGARHKIMSHAILYVLLGVYAASQHDASFLVDSESASMLCDIASTPGLPEVPRGTINVLCKHILDRSKQIELDRTVRTKQKMLDAHYQIVCRDSAYPNVSRLSIGPSIEDIVDEMISTKYSCLDKDGLDRCCDHIIRQLDIAERDADAAILNTALTGIWEAVEIQDFPKTALLRLPRLFLNRTTVALVLIDDTLKLTVQTFLTSYSNLLSGRIYTWPALVLSVRDVSLHEPRILTVLNIPAMILACVKSPPSARPEFQLDAAAVRALAGIEKNTSSLTYSHYYGEDAGLGWAAFFDLLNRISFEDPEVGSSLLTDIMDIWKPRPKAVPIVNKLKTTEQLQAIAILIRRQDIIPNKARAEAYSEKLLAMLAAEPLPRYRFVMECMIGDLIARYPDIWHNIHLLLLSDDHHGNPKFLASAIKIAHMVVCSQAGTEDMAKEVMQCFAGLAASSKIIVRHEAQWALPDFFRQAEARGWSSITNDAAMLGLMRYLHSLERTITPASERENARFVLDKDWTLSNLLSGSHLALEPAVQPRVFPEDVQRLQHLDKQHNLELKGQPALPWGPTPGKRMQPLTSDPSNDVDSLKESGTDMTSAVQTKGTSYLSGSISDIKSRRSRSTLLVVASLVDNPYNLGGLSRVAEIFGAAALYVDNTKILRHKDFESVAVSSHMHFDVRELPVKQMIDFFGQMRTEGYCIAGIEQTDRSQILGKNGSVLPAKTVLVLGAEREGMPGNILAQCDVLMEIPQKGSTRSLNVQTAAACVLFDYCRQHG